MKCGAGAVTVHYMSQIMVFLCGTGLARLVALVLPPRMHLTRFHGVFAPHSRRRAAVTPAGRGMGAPPPPVAEAKPDTPRRAAPDHREHRAA